MGHRSGIKRPLANLYQATDLTGSKERSGIPHLLGAEIVTLPGDPPFLLFSHTGMTGLTSRLDVVIGSRALFVIKSTRKRGKQDFLFGIFSVGWVRPILGRREASALWVHLKHVQNLLRFGGHKWFQQNTTHPYGFGDIVDDSLGLSRVLPGRRIVKVLIALMPNSSVQFEGLIRGERKRCVWLLTNSMIALISCRAARGFRLFMWFATFVGSSLSCPS